MYDKIIDWIDRNYLWVYTVMIILIIVLVYYGITNQNGFEAKGY